MSNFEIATQTTFFFAKYTQTSGSSEAAILGVDLVSDLRDYAAGLQDLAATFGSSSTDRDLHRSKPRRRDDVPWCRICAER